MGWTSKPYVSASQYRSPYAGNRNPFHKQKEDEMARGQKARDAAPDADAGEGGGIVGQYARPDAAKAFDIYDKQIAPKLTQMATVKGDLSQPYDDIKQHAHFPRSVLNFIVKLEGEEDAKRDHMLLALAEGLRHRKLFLPRDLVTMANGEDGGEVIPTSDTEGDALDVLEDDEEFEELSEAELALQEGRGAPAAGTGAAARKAMNKSRAAEASAATH